MSGVAQALFPASCCEASNCPLRYPARRRFGVTTVTRAPMAIASTSCRIVGAADELIGVEEELTPRPLSYAPNALFSNAKWLRDMPVAGYFSSKCALSFTFVQSSASAGAGFLAMIGFQSLASSALIGMNLR